LNGEHIVAIDNLSYAPRAAQQHWRSVIGRNSVCVGDQTGTKDVEVAFYDGNLPLPFLEQLSYNGLGTGSMVHGGMVSQVGTIRLAPAKL
jgi:hypothetical protein